MASVIRPLILTVALVALVTGSGCNTIASTLGFTPPVHKLIEPAEQFRNAAINPAPLPRELEKASLPPFVVEPGDFKVWVGQNSADGLEADFAVK